MKIILFVYLFLDKFERKYVEHRCYHKCERTLTFWNALNHWIRKFNHGKKIEMQLSEKKNKFGSMLRPMRIFQCAHRTVVDEPVRKAEIPEMTCQLWSQTF